MSEIGLNDIAKSWIRLNCSEINSARYEEDFWSFERLDDLCRKNPDDAWKVIIEIYEARPGEKVLSNLAAGPIEDLLVNYGELVLIWIEKYCEKEDGFVDILRMVWKNSMSEEIWGELQKLILSRI